MQTKSVESIIIGWAMNPIWTIDNPEDQSEEVLDGMHRLNTALGFLDNKFKLIGKCFKISELGVNMMVGIIKIWTMIVNTVFAIIILREVRSVQSFEGMITNGV